MKALVKYRKGQGNVEIREMPEPSCTGNQVKIEVAYCGICGTDLHVLHDTFPNYPPVIMGHEFSGTVVEIGPDAKGVSVGDRVTVLPASAVTCGTCIYCRTGRFMFCPERRGMGHGVNGAFTRYAVIRDDQAYHIPDEVSLEEAALCEPFAAAVQPVLEITKVTPGDIVLVSGPGPIGLMCLKLLAASGIRTIVACTGKDGVRASAAEKIGAYRVVNVEKESLADVVMEETDGSGVDVVFECSGAAASASACLAAVRPLGSYTQVGIFGRPVELDMDTVIYKQLQVRGSVGYTVETWRKASRIIKQRRILLSDLISDVLPLDQWRRGFDLSEGKDGIKILIAPGDRK